MLHYTPGIRCVIMQNKKNISHAIFIDSSQLSCKQSHTSRKNDVFIVLESETTLPLIIVVIIQNRRKITPKKTLDQFPFFLIYIPALYVHSGYQIKHKNLLNRIRPLKNISDRMRKTYFRHNKTKIL